MTTAPEIKSGEETTVVIPLATGPRRELDAFLARPAGESTAPGVVIIHEIFGLNDNIRAIARQWAGEGYAALAVDLFSRASRVICMMRVIQGMMFKPLDNGIVAELQACVDWLQAQPGVDPRRIGVIGFCMGGTYALQLACRDRDVKAASVYYGQNPRPLDVIAQSCPVVGSYPEKDYTARAGRELEAALTERHIAHDIKVYPGTVHSFNNDLRSSFDPESSADAWQRMVSFFNRYVKG